MSNSQQLIKQGLEIANSGIFKKENVNKIIKADFLNQYHSANCLMKLYSTLATKYGVSVSTVRNICR